MHGTSPNEDGNAVMSSTITRIESMPQAEYDKLRKEGKARDSVIYLTKSFRLTLRPCKGGTGCQVVCSKSVI